MKTNPIEDAKTAIKEKDPVRAHRLLLPILTEIELTGEAATDELLGVLAALVALDKETFGRKEVAPR